MVVGALERGFEVCVIGGGPGGYLTAIRLAQLGKDVALIEASDRLGGICLNEGCIPSKALIHASDFFYSAKKAETFGIKIEGNLSVDFTKLIKWKDQIVNKLTDGVKFLSEKNGVELIKGYAKFLNDHSLTVSTSDGASQTINFQKCIIATGSSPYFPDGFAPDNEFVLGPRDILSIKDIPKKLIVLGGGYIGLEMAALFAKFGSQVSLVEANNKILKNHDDEVREATEKRFKTLKIEMVMAFRAKSIDREAKMVEVINNESEIKKIEGDKVLIALGRNPNTKDIGIENVNVGLDERGFIKVNEKMQTSNPNIYAIGDVIGGPLLAHKAYREAKVAAEVIAEIPSAFDNVVIPAVIYTDPEIAWAGLSQKEAEQKGINISVGSFPFHASGRALTLDSPTGFVKTIAEKETKRIIGVEIVGYDASELISEAALAIEMGAFLDDLSKTIHPHPSMSEALLESAEAALGEAVHIINKT